VSILCVEDLKAFDAHCFPGIDDINVCLETDHSECAMALLNDDLVLLCGSSVEDDDNQCTVVNIWKGTIED